MHTSGAKQVGTDAQHINSPLHCWFRKQWRSAISSVAPTASEVMVRRGELSTPHVVRQFPAWPHRLARHFMTVIGSLPALMFSGDPEIVKAVKLLTKCYIHEPRGFIASLNTLTIAILRDNRKTYPRISSYKFVIHLAYDVIWPITSSGDSEINIVYFYSQVVQGLAMLFYHIGSADPEVLRLGAKNDGGNEKNWWVIEW